MKALQLIEAGESRRNIWIVNVHTHRIHLSFGHVNRSSNNTIYSYSWNGA